MVKNHLLVVLALLISGCQVDSAAGVDSGSPLDSAAGDLSMLDTVAPEDGTPADLAQPLDTAEALDTVQPLDTLQPLDTVPAKTVWADVKDLLATKCGNCHSKYKTYAGAKKEGKKGLNTVLSNYMPEGKKFTAAEKALYKAWIDDGMLP
jgi:hypothetical protein